MSKTQKWLRFAVLGAVAIGAVGFANASQVNGPSKISLSKVQRRYHESEWRGMHPGWNGRLYWHNNAYYFDRAYATPAIVDHEYTAIGAGVTLNSDPYVYVSGSYGSLYPTASLNIDLGSTDTNRHARALYFQHPYFWRDGVRYDRTTVTRKGTQYYRFARHRY